MALNISFSDFLNVQPEETESMKKKTRKRVATSKFMAKNAGKGNGNAAGSAPTPHQSAAATFRASHRHDAPLPPTDSERIWEMQRAAAIRKMTDGKGDHDCGHGHDK